MPKFIDRTGHKYGNLKVIKRATKEQQGNQKNVLWGCECDCGKITFVSGDRLSAGITKSCGCYRSAIIAAKNKTHGMVGTGSYKAWQSMTARCLRDYGRDAQNYKNRGIKVCDEWHLFEKFYADMGDRPIKMTIERIDNNKGYYKENCRWATQSEQMRNTRRTSFIEVLGIKKSIAEWSEIFSISRHSVKSFLLSEKGVLEVSRLL